MSRWFLTYGFADVLDDLVIGAYPLDRADVAMLERLRVERVLNLAKDEEYSAGDRASAADALDEAGIAEYRLGITDYGNLSPETIDAVVNELNSWLDQGIRTYLHCRAGWQRSAALAAAAIAVRRGIDIDEALEFVQERKPLADPLPHQREDLRRWWDARQGAAADGDTKESGE